MIALYNQDCILVGWLDNEEYIYDLEMNWIAYASNGNVWSTKTNKWLGPIHGLNCLDKTGKPVAWSPEDYVEGLMISKEYIEPIAPKMPLEPLAPLAPLEPLKPLAPIEPRVGWAKVSFEEWIGN